MIQHYMALGLKPPTHPDGIKQAFRQLAKKYHPDTGGDPRRFARIRAAYEALSNDLQRETFERVWRQTNHRAKPSLRTVASPSAKARPKQQASPKTASSSQAQAHRRQQPRYTRLMSVAVPQAGRVKLSGFCGTIIIETTSDKNLRDSTRKKFSKATAKELREHVVQIRVSGDRRIVQGLLPAVKPFGLLFEGPDAGMHFFRKPPPAMEKTRRKAFTGASGFGDEQGFKNPVTLVLTIPKRMAIHLEDIQGKVTLGDQDATLVGDLKGNVLVRAGLLRHANLSLKGNSKVYLTRLDGNADILAYDESQLRLDGSIHRLRAVGEGKSIIESLANVAHLQADLKASAAMNLKGVVERAFVEAAGESRIKMAHVRREIQQTLKGKARIEVTKRSGIFPFFNFLRKTG